MRARDEGGGISVHMRVSSDKAVDELILSGGFGDVPPGTSNSALGMLKTSVPEWLRRGLHRQSTTIGSCRANKFAYGTESTFLTI